MMQSKKQSKGKTLKAFTIPPKNTPISISNPIPDYEDSGVRFQGYYKRQISGNQYELKKQIPADIIPFALEGSGSAIRQLQVTQTRRQFITGISFCWKLDPASTPNVRSLDIFAPDGTMIIQIPFHATGSNQLIFNPPIQIREVLYFPQNLYFVLGSVGGTDSISGNITGFLEDK